MPKNCDQILWLTFEPEDIKVNESALEEMVIMIIRNEALFFWQLPLIELNGICICLFSVRSWNGHLEHFLSDKISQPVPTYSVSQKPI